MAIVCVGRGRHSNTRAGVAGYPGSPASGSEPELVVYHGACMLIPARSADTDPDAERVQVALFREASVARRLQLAQSLSDTVRQLARRALAVSGPEASFRDLALRFVEVHYGVELAAGLRADFERRDKANRASA